MIEDTLAVVYDHWKDLVLKTRDQIEFKAVWYPMNMNSGSNIDFEVSTMFYSCTLFFPFLAIQLSSIYLRCGQ